MLKIVCAAYLPRHRHRYGIWCDSISFWMFRSLGGVDWGLWDLQLGGLKSFCRRWGTRWESIPYVGRELIVYQKSWSKNEAIKSLRSTKRMIRSVPLAQLNASSAWYLLSPTVDVEYQRSWMTTGTGHWRRWDREEVHWLHPSLKQLGSYNWNLHLFNVNTSSIGSHLESLRLCSTFFRNRLDYPANHKISCSYPITFLSSNFLATLATHSQSDDHCTRVTTLSR